MKIMKYNEEQRKSIIEESIGKTVSEMEYVEDESYWVMTFTDGSEISFKFMAELTAPPSRVCSVCGDEIPEGSLTCGGDCHEIAIDFIESQFGVYKKVTDEVSGITYKVPVRDIIEKGLKQPDLVNYPLWTEDD